MLSLSQRQYDATDYTNAKSAAHAAAIDVENTALAYRYGLATYERLQTVRTELSNALATLRHSEARLMRNVKP